MTEFQPSKLGLISAILQSNVDKKSKPDEPAVELCNYTDVYYNDTITADLAFMKATASPDQIERLRLSEGDVIITKDSETADDIGIPAYVDSTHDSLVCGYHLTILRAHPQKAFPKFLYYSMLTRETGEYWEKRANGVTRVSIPQQVVSSLTIPLPNLETQHRIADYLDKEISEMDAMIEEFKELVRNLRARKPMLIDNLLAGFPVAPLALSWKVVDCLHITAPFIDSGKNYLVSIEQLGSEDLILDGANRTDSGTFSNLREGERKPSPGDVIMSRNASVGKSSIVKESDPPIALGQDVVIFKNNEKNDSRLLFYFLQSNALKQTVDMNTVGSTLKRINVSSIKSLPYPVLALEVQQSIADRLRRETSKMDSLIEESTRLIENLKARKTALITEVVTGRKEV
ncbi:MULTISPECIES: restriction endonuclease subunit S [unclassified Corynebacterium]|uniref:restriction endonuclease subunit S n=1 Tax=unclassified Corynebacterium TaxID=2624378 RepID=UPI0008A27999|nr:MULTISPECIES: restriction endonuclease subunit S [unclassified Corynebacterium]OFN77434.1 hypothetical protein HMPREF2537_08185 [Corynebacterium sp. HMSC074E01]OFP66344.1 hypothetical protein HMPREF2978_05620 [Corynebacterium sp. HMSC074C01]OHO62711.1 hypothetical protein HMPREF2743_10540 [Corynebacterium sp. HMSC036D02]